MSHHYSGPNWGFPYDDARLDLTDLYAFPKPGNAGKSILIMNVHPSARDFLDDENPLAPTTAVPFAPEALYELKIDTDGNAVADIAYRMRFSSSASGAQTATLRRVEGAEAAGTGQMPKLLARFRDKLLPIWERHGIRPIGFWTTLVGESSNELTYILQWGSLADRETRWTAFQNDPAWHKVRDESERDGPIVASINNQILTPTPFSALK